MHRRKFLASSAVGLVATVAGCSSGDGGSGDSGTEDSGSDSTDDSGSSSGEAGFFIETNVPESADIGEQFVIELVVNNTGESTGTWTSTVSIIATPGPEPDPNSERWQREEIELEVPAGESETWSTNEVSFERPSVVYFQIDDRDMRTIDIPSSRVPIIEEVNLVTEWNTYGDAIENEISEAEAGSIINIAARFWYWAENQSVETFRQIEVYNEAEERVGIRTANLEQVGDNSGWTSRESYLPFDTTDWGTGTYTARLLIRDEQNQEVSEEGTVEFDLV